jgi:hypothetical protein
MAPLETINGTQITLGAVHEPTAIQELTRRISIPYGDVLRAELCVTRRAANEPEQFLETGLARNTLRRQYRNDTICQRKSHGSPKYNTCMAITSFLDISTFDDFAN